MATVLPYLLSVLSLINILTVWQARRLILAGNWLAHRHYMVISLALWSGTLFLFAVYLWMRGLRVLVAVPEVIFALYVVSVALTGGLLVVTLNRVRKHLYLPHKMLARKTILVWLWCCLYGILFFPLTDARIYPISSSL